MRQIIKLQQPTNLIEFRATARQTPGMGYEDYPFKSELREQLVQEQRGLCCYCLCRIRAGGPNTRPLMKIAHWHSQSLHGNEALDYTNMLGACMGGTGTPYSSQHCDTRQGNRDIKWNPANPSHQIEDKIKFLTDGTVRSEDMEFNDQINEVLNLNAAFLIRNRKAVLISFQQALAKRQLSLRNGSKLLDEWNGVTHDGELEEYCQIVVFWLRKKIARA